MPATVAATGSAVLPLIESISDISNRETVCSDSYIRMSMQAACGRCHL
jgi:hypothetical protein